MRSASKSVVSILIGIAIDQNKLSGVDMKAHEFFPEYRGTKWIDRSYKITLKDLLTMTAGLDWDEWSYPDSNPRSSVYKLFHNTDNWEKNIFNLDHVTPTGEQFAYNSMLTHLLGQITAKAAGMNMVKFAEENLFTPIGISDYTWKGPIWSTGLSLKPRDMAKIGYLFLRQGKWDGKQIVSTEWVQESTKSHVKAFFGGSEYGYQWWRGKAASDHQIIHTYYAAGRGGQYIFVVPQLDLVVVFTSQALNNSPGGELYPHVIMTEYIIPAIVPQSFARKRATSVPMDSAQYVGEYHFQRGLKLSVIKEADDIFLMTFDGEKVELTPVAEDRFYGKLEDIGNVEIRFHKNEKGEVTNLGYNIGFAYLPFEKIN
jgi:CubicO group peptidase (beta-lactamase class C family)